MDVFNEKGTRGLLFHASVIMAQNPPSLDFKKRPGAEE